MRGVRVRVPHPVSGPRARRVSGAAGPNQTAPRHRPHPRHRHSLRGLRQGRLTKTDLGQKYPLLMQCVFHSRENATGKKGYGI